MIFSVSLIALAVLQFGTSPDRQVVARFSMQPLWSIAAEHDEDIVFGQIEDVLIAPDNTIYVLDTQLDEIQVLNAAGTYLRTIGREGDGPGEFRAPASLVAMPDGSLGVVSRQAGAITKLDPMSGLPRGTLRVAGLGTQAVQLGRVRALPGASPDNAVVVVVREPVYAQSASLVYGLWSYLAVFNDFGDHGAVVPSYRLLDIGEVSGQDIEEENYYHLWEPWAVTADGTVVAAPYWSKYELRFYTASGQFDGAVSYGFRQRERSEDERKRFLNYLWGGVSPDRFGVELVVSETEAVVRAIYPRPDGSLWVRTNRAGLRRDQGVFLTLDVIARDRSRQGLVQIEGAGDESLDRVYFGGDGLLVVAHGAERFIRTARGRDQSGLSYDLVLSGYRLNPLGGQAGKNR